MASALRGGGDEDSKGQLLCLLWWQYNSDAGWSSSVARRAHNPKVVGSNPAPATNYLYPWQALAPAVETKTARGNCSVSCGAVQFGDAGWSSSVARRAHNPKVVGSNPAPATNYLCPWQARCAAVETKTARGICSVSCVAIQFGRGVEQLVARRAHNPKVVGSNPAPATNYLYPWQALAPAVETKTARDNCSVSCGGSTIRTRGGAAR